MKPKKASILLSMVTIFSATTFIISSLTFAWINWNYTFDNELTLHSGKDVLNIEYYTYFERYNEETHTLDRLDPTHATPEAYFKKTDDGYVMQPDDKTIIDFTPGETAITVDYNFSLTPDLLNYYLDETSVNIDPFPKVYFEFRYIKEVSNGYLTGEIENTTKGTPSDLFQYRLLPTRDNLTNGILNNIKNETKGPIQLEFENAIAQGYKKLNSRATTSPYDFIYPRKDLFATPETANQKIPLFDLYDRCVPDDFNNVKPGEGEYSATKEEEGKIPAQCFIPSYKSKNGKRYSKASLIELSINEEKFKNIALANLATQTPINFNISFQFNFDFSNTPYYLK